MTEQAEPKPQAVVTERDKAFIDALLQTIWEALDEEERQDPSPRETLYRASAAYRAEVAAQAKREALEKLRPFLIHRGAFHHGANCNALTKEPWGAPGGECDCGLKEAIRALAVEPEVCSCKMSARRHIHDPEHGIIDEPEVKERKTIVHQGPLQADGTWHSPPPAPSKAEELPLIEHPFYQHPAGFDYCIYLHKERQFGQTCGQIEAAHRKARS